MTLPIFQVDAFTDKPFAGNPAAVCLLPGARDASWMQNVAREMNLSETAFLFQEGDGFHLRWFTPTVEVDLCGHATLASAHILWEEKRLKPHEEARFRTRGGLLTAYRRGDWIEMDFPAQPDEPVEAPSELVQGLGVTPRYVGRTRFDYLVEVEFGDAVRSLKPDFRLLATLPVRGVMVTSVATSSPGYDFICRFFAPQSGIDEDPVTGSAFCSLGPFWKQRLHRDEFLAYQASARGGVVRVRVGDERVYLGGQAVTVLRGDLADG